MGVFLGIVVVLALSAFWGTVSTTNSLIRLLTLICLGQMWNLLAGYAGLVSIGQQAYIGVGAYTLVYLANERGVDVFLSLILAAVVCAVIVLPLAGGAIRRFDVVADVAVVGGASGVPAALFSRWLGNEVVLLEKAPQLGGTANRAAFSCWVPNNAQMQALGIADPEEDFLRYCARLSAPRALRPCPP